MSRFIVQSMIVFALIVSLLRPAPVSAQTADEFNSELQGIKDCSITALQLLMGEVSSSSEEEWVGVTFGETKAKANLPLSNPRGYGYVSKVHSSRDFDVHDWIGQDNDILFHNENGLVGFAHDGNTYVLGDRCYELSETSTHWTRKSRFTHLETIEIETPEVTFKNHFFVGDELSAPDVLALAKVPDGLFGKTQYAQGLVTGEVDGFDIVPGTMYVATTGVLHWSPKIGAFSMPLGLRIPFNTDVLMITEFLECNGGTCPPPLVQSVVYVNHPQASAKVVIVNYDRADYIDMIGGNP